MTLSGVRPEETPDPERQSSTPDGGVRLGASSSGTGTRRRLDHIDAMRPVKQAGVVSTHTLLAFAPATSLALGASLMLLHVTREAFLFVSACMLTYSYRGLGGGLGRFYWRRFAAVGIPYLCWTVIYFFVTLDPAAGWQSSLRHLGYLTESGYYQLYYLLIVMQFYVVFPLLVLALARLDHHHVAVVLTSGLLQVAMISLAHWGVLPSAFEGFWGSRNLLSYQFYLVTGMVVALHLTAVHEWLRSHMRLVVGATLVAAGVAEAWYYLAAVGHIGWLGSRSDPFQPIVIPFNIGAIACIYLAGMALVDRRRSPRVRAMTSSGSDNAYGVYLAQMIFIIALGAVGWGRLTRVVPWPFLCAGTVALVFVACVLVTSVLARTPLSKALTGRSRASWESWLPRRSAARPSAADGAAGRDAAGRDAAVVAGRDTEAGPTWPGATPEGTPLPGSPG